jgi:hypothetical protein
MTDRGSFSKSNRFNSATFQRACLKIPRGAVCSKTLPPSPKLWRTSRATGLLAVGRVGSVVTARRGDAPPSPPCPHPKSLAAAPFAILRQALTPFMTWQTAPASSFRKGLASIRSEQPKTRIQIPFCHNYRTVSLSPPFKLERINEDSDFFWNRICWHKLQQFITNPLTAIANNNFDFFENANTIVIRKRQHGFDNS